MAPGSGDAHAVVCAEADNRRLRAENLRLRTAVATSRPVTAQACPDAAGELAQLLREGGELLKEKQGLAVQNSQLAIEIVRLTDGIDGATSIAVALGKLGDGGAQSAEDGELAALERLLPLLSEGELLQAERHQLTTERCQLVGTVSALPKEAAGVAQSPLSPKAERKLRAAVEYAREQNSDLQADLLYLQHDRALLCAKRDAALASKHCTTMVSGSAFSSPRSTSPGGRRRRRHMGTTDPDARIPVEDVVLEPETPELIEERRQKEVSLILRKQMQYSAPPTPHRIEKLSSQPLPGKLSLQEVQHVAVRDALQSLIRGQSR